MLASSGPSPARASWEAAGAPTARRRSWRSRDACPSCGLRSRAVAVGGEVHATLLAEEGGDPARALVSQLDALREACGGPSGVLAATLFAGAASSAALEGGLRAAGLSPAVVELPPCCESCRAALQVELASSAGAERGGRHIRIGAIRGRSAGRTARAEFIDTFERAAAALEEVGARFDDVVRTWIFLSDIDRDYDDLNRARAEFFAARGISVFPASTGIGGAPPAGGASRMTLSLWAIAPAGGPPPRTSTLHAATFNEAPEYGSLFSRGLRVETGGEVRLLVSGTAAIDERGRSCGGDSVAAQIERTLVNISGLTAEAAGPAAACVQAVTYFRRPADAAGARDALERSGLLDVPHAIVRGDICRPELLCEMELIAAL